MNEEEIIQTINNMLLHAETQLLDYEALAIQGLLDLYKQEKEKNKEAKYYIYDLLNDLDVPNVGIDDIKILLEMLEG